MGNAESFMQLPWLRGRQNAEDMEFSGTATEGSLLAMGAWSLVSSSGFGDLEGDGVPRGGTGYQRPDNLDSGSIKKTFRIMSYNVMSDEKVHVNERMKVIGKLIEHHSPDIVFFQDVNRNIYEIFKSSSWWNLYKCSVSPEKAILKVDHFCMMLSKLPVRGFICKLFKDSGMNREICAADIDTGLDKKLVVATSQLESSTAAETNTDKRLAQVDELQSLFSHFPNVIFGGDFNWDENKDGDFPLNNGWIDAWNELKPGENGWTYDTETNPMLKGNNSLQKRFDRFICKSEDFCCKSVELIGIEAISQLSKTNENEISVLPSDHYGLILTISTE
ncbi:hypothetical protein J5N97_027323 [Dioscorea zingiberensis]|uniref:Endonuclease/exonuclease/phosphatase domain-containing protein n=1 Tax=Dioscorea zingiberensis TaxID=325984 RepID=A0A9D5C3Z5_9LILI|nr:hypothetical protein J5N97_027323 [Dioscorea zingiberensis]